VKQALVENEQFHQVLHRWWSL